MATFVRIDWKAALLLGIVALVAIGLVFYPETIRGFIDGVVGILRTGYSESLSSLMGGIAP